MPAYERVIKMNGIFWAREPTKASVYLQMDISMAAAHTRKHKIV